jgi:hypothetical protein
MNWIAARIKWIMLVSGVLTCTMFYAAIAPEAAVLSMFGAGIEGTVAELIARNWGVLIGLVGVMLIYGAYHPPSRPLALTVAAASKLCFAGLVLSHGQQFLGQQAGISIAVDLVMAVTFVAYLAGGARRSGAHT